MKRVSSLRTLPTAAVMIAGLASAFPASAAVVDWGLWSHGYTAGNPTGAATAGFSGGRTATYSGELQFINFGYPSFGPGSTFTGGSVSNAPPSANGLVAVYGGTSTIDRITFSSAVKNPVLAIWSLGQPGAPTSFVFGQPFSVQSGGPSNEYHFSGYPETLTQSGLTVTGEEGNGTLRFNGTFTQISWNNPGFENYYGFTVGVSAVPETSTWMMMLLGFAGLGFAGYRRQKTGVATA